MKALTTTWSFKKNYKILTQTLIKNHLQQWTHISWQFIILIQNNLSMIQNIFDNTAADS